jgi:thiamine biosynthesis protein ThiS
MAWMISINGELQVYQAQTLQELLVACKLNQCGVAVAVNARIIPRARWPLTQLQPDDRVKIVCAFAAQTRGWV